MQSARKYPVFSRSVLEQISHMSALTKHHPLYAPSNHSALHSATDPQSVSRPQALLPHQGHPYKHNTEQFYRTVSGFPSAFRADRISPISSSSFSIPFISSISLIVSLYCLESCGIVFGPSTTSFAHISICFARISAKFSKRSKRLPSLVTVAIFLALPI